MVCVKSLAEERFLYVLETYEDSVSELYMGQKNRSSWVMLSTMNLWGAHRGVSNEWLVHFNGDLFHLYKRV